MAFKVAFEVSTFLAFKFNTLVTFPIRQQRVKRALVEERGISQKLRINKIYIKCSSFNSKFKIFIGLNSKYLLQKELV